MSADSKIEWTDASWNCLRGCSRTSPGCEKCYAETMAGRFSKPGQAFHGFVTKEPGRPARWTRKVELIPELLDLPLHWKKPRKIFVNSMSDLFHESLPNEVIAAIFGVMAACPRHTFQILTKRAGRLPEWFEWLKARTRGHMHGAHGALWEAFEPIDADLADRAWKRIVAAEEAKYGGPPKSIGDATAHPWPLPNVWLGVSVEDQQRADERIPHLLRAPAAVRFLSCEPLLGPINLHPWLCENGDPSRPEQRWCESICTPRAALHWGIGGGESGPGARSNRIEWLRSLVGQFGAARIPFFMKQTGTRLDVPFYAADDGDREFFEGRGHDWTPEGWDKRDGQPAPDALVQLRLSKKDCSNPEEWPVDMRVRQFPEAINGK